MISLILFLFLLASVSSENTTFPIEYHITIVPELSDLTFTSATRITIVVEQPVSTITLNSRNLQIEELKVFDSAAEEISDVEFNVNGESETIEITFGTELEENLYDLVINTSGNLNEKYEGLYVSKYTKLVSGVEEERTIVLTNLKYDNARQVFPCFDNPTQLSTFTLTLVSPKNYISVSNTAKTSSEEYDDNQNIDVFAPTDPIPPYGLSFAIIDFVEEEFEGTTVYSVTKEETQYLGLLSAHVSQKFQELYPHKVNKIHQIVVPDNSLSTDVVNNIGLIIYKESAVVYNSERESVEDKQEIAKLIALAVIKQYQRDSFEWWPNFWAKIGTLISYQYDVLDKLDSTWRLYDQFVAEELFNLLGHDVGENDVSVLLPEDQTPDAFTQSQLLKSFTFVRMFSHFPVPGDILEDETNAAALSWIENKGHPTLTVTRNFDDVDNKVTFEQGSQVIRSVPINIVFENQEHDSNHFDFVLETGEEQVNYPDYVSSSWFIVNLERLGYYRVNYDTSNWENLATSLRNSRNDLNAISPANRAVLLQDAFYFNQLEEISATVYLELASYLNRETDYIPIYAFIKTANEMKSLLAQTTSQTKFMTYATSLVEHLYEHIGTTVKPSDTHTDTLARTKILTWLCSFGYAKCQEEMHELLSKSEAVQPDLQELVYCGGLRLGNIERFEFLNDQHVEHGKKRILRSMGCTSDTEILSYLIRAVFDHNLILTLDQEDKVDAFLAVLEGSDEGVELALSFAKQYLEQMLTSFSDKEIEELFIALSKKLVTDAHFQTIEAIMECLSDEQKLTYGALFATVTNKISENQKWRNLNVDIIEEWLDASTTTTDSTTTTTTHSTITNSTTTTPKPPTDGAADLKVPVILLVVFLLPFIFSTNQI